MSLVVLVTVPSGRAHELARTLVHERLAGCVNVLPGVHSVYRWEGEVAEEPETLLLVKTTGERYPDLESRIRGMHPYEVPEKPELRVQTEGVDVDYAAQQVLLKLEQMGLIGMSGAAAA